jgi:membrane-associated phospholipid phosphatase
VTIGSGTESRGAGISLAPLTRCLSTAAGWAATLVSPPRRPLGILTIDLHRIAVVAIAMLVAVISAMAWLDARAMVWQDGISPGVVWLFEEITDFGRSGWVLIPAGVLMLLVAAINSPALGRMTNLVLTAVIVRLGFIFIAVALPGLLVTVIKRLIGRVRPSDLGPFAYYPFSWKATYASLPSGHTTTAFAALVAIGLIWPRARPVLWVYALMVGLSRVVVSAHFPSDVVAGAACGALGALLVREWFAVRRLGFVVGSDEQIRALPGPSFRRIKGVVRRLLGQ